MLDVGVKIQARNESFLNPTIPSRNDVRKLNYTRRLAQLNSEGFYSKLWKPYICIGHPLELDKALEISVSLDNKKQVEIKNEPQTETKTGESFHETYTNRSLQSSQNQKKPSEKFELLNKNVKDEIRKSELVNFNVRTGHSFFDILQKEQDDKKSSVIEAIKLQKLKDTTEIRPPVVDSDSDSEVECHISNDKDHTSRPSTGLSKKRPNSRPYTPIYNNISSLTKVSTTFIDSEYGASTRSSTGYTTGVTDDIKEASLYRQLCCLRWLLKAMVAEGVDNMPTISLSWTMKNKDNDLTSSKNRKELKIAWEKYVAKSEPSSNVHKNRIMINMPTAFQSTRSSNANQSTKFKDKNSDSDSINQFHLPKSNKATNDTPSTTTNRLSSTGYRSNSPASIVRRRKMIEQVRSVCEDLEKDHNDYEYKKNLHMIRIGKRPVDNTRITESTKLQREDKFSDKLKLMMSKQQDLSSQLIDERITNLRENVRNMSEYKVMICVNKYKDIQTKGAFHQMLKSFRGKNTYQNVFAELDKSRNKIIYTDWFLSLNDSLREYSENKRIVHVVDKIRKYALNTITKLNIKRLLAVLKNLADWEIRHPDVSASIKFITEHVVLMPEEQYQMWFNQNFA